jgi:uncharacterized iron-regulated protein
MREGLLRLLGVCALVLGIGACATASGPMAHGDVIQHHGAMSLAPVPSVAARSPDDTPAIQLDRVTALKNILPELERKRVIYVGETHDEYAHHLIQLEIIKRLHEVDPRLAIGVEFFQQPFQEKLDAYTAGKLDERQMLMATGYFDRWGYDYRLYAPIVRYARENRLPLVALNVSAELMKKVREQGIDGLTPEDRAQLPADIDRSDPAYAARIQEVYEQHPRHESTPFARFLDVQLLWDEGMAERAASYLRAHPDYRMVVLTGSGHVAFGSGIPKRLNRRVPVASAIVLNGWQGPLAPDIADYLLMPDEQILAPAGRIGVTLEPDGPVMRVVSCAEDSPCADAGLKKGDQLVAIEGVPIADMNGVRAVMWERKPGDTISLTMRREHLVSRAVDQQLQIVLR